MDTAIFFLGFLTVLSIADSVTTHIHIKNGAREGNPISRKIFGAHPSLAELLALRLGGVLLVGSLPYWFAETPLREAVLGMGVGAALIVVMLNVYEYFDD